MSYKLRLIERKLRQYGRRLRAAPFPGARRAGKTAPQRRASFDVFGADGSRKRFVAPGLHVCRKTDEITMTPPWNAAPA
jgi:hypothetical protein